MTKKRIATMATCIALVGAVAVGGTLALLSQTSNKVTNTFAVGEGYGDNQVVTLDEAIVTQLTNGNYIEGIGRTESNNYDKLVNNTTLHKYPTVTVKANTVDSWVVAYIDNVDEIFSTSKFQDGNDTWYKVTKSGSNWDVAEAAVAGTPITKGYYIYKDVVKKNAKEQKLPDLFETLKVSFTVAPEAVTGLNVKAGVVQYTAGTTDATQLDQPGINAVMSTVETALTQMN